MPLPSAAVDQRLWNHSVRLALSLGCKVSGLRGGAQRSDTDSTAWTLDDGKTGTKQRKLRSTEKPSDMSHTPTSQNSQVLHLKFFTGGEQEDLA